MSLIRFYKVNEPYGFFSNFAPFPIFIENQIWQTVEHYFQASKFEDELTRKKIMSADSPMKAAKEGRKRENILKKDWDLIKENVMSKALFCKFTQHPKLRKQLLLTENNLLVEHTENDSYWGDGGNGTGKNRLGELLMQVRENIKQYSSDTELVLPPWIAFPTIHQEDLFWRMGLGEDYLIEWAGFYLKSDKLSYKKMFPETMNWLGIYD